MIHNDIRPLYINFYQIDCWEETDFFLWPTELAIWLEITAFIFIQFYSFIEYISMEHISLSLSLSFFFFFG